MADLRAGIRSIDAKFILLAIVTGIAFAIGGYIAHRAIKKTAAEVQTLEDSTSG